jgi:hypothetical protein
MNKAGNSARTISRKIGFSKTSVLRTLKSLSADPENKVVDNSRVFREQGRWYQIIEHVIEALPYFNSRGIKPSVRTMFYRLETLKHINKTEYEYDRLVKYTVLARKGITNKITGELLYPKLPIDCFSDETREMSENYEDYEPTEPESPKDSDEYIDEKIKELKDAPENYDGIGTAGEVGGHWYNQPEYVEVWIEKQALGPTFETFLKDRHVNIVVNKGYSSLTFLHENCVRLGDKLLEYEPENVHVLYFGDWDPSGEDMDRYIKDTFDFFDVDSDIFERVSITPKQIQEYNLPTRPLKAGDSRMNGFEEIHGDRATELDAFLAVNADAFEKMVQDSVDNYYDQDIYDDMEEKYSEDPEEMNDTDLDEARKKMYTKITEAFKEGWDVDYHDDDNEA